MENGGNWHGLVNSRHQFLSFNISIEILTCVMIGGLIMNIQVESSNGKSKVCFRIGCKLYSKL